MTDEQHSVLKASDINSMEAFEFHHPLNPNSEIYLRFLGRAVGLKRIGVTIARVPSGKESFIFHAGSGCDRVPTPTRMSNIILRKYWFF